MTPAERRAAEIAADVERHPERGAIAVALIRELLSRRVGGYDQWCAITRAITDKWRGHDPQGEDK